jgi:hypothetical protein
MKLSPSDMETVLRMFGQSLDSESGDANRVYVRDGVVRWSDQPGNDVPLGTLAELLADERARILAILGLDS